MTKNELEIIVKQASYYVCMYDKHIFRVLDFWYFFQKERISKEEFADYVVEYLINYATAFLTEHAAECYAEYVKLWAKQENIIKHEIKYHKEKEINKQKKSEDMNIKELLSINPNVQLVVSAADLKEFALSLIEEAKIIEEEKPEPMFTPKEFAARHGVDKSTLWRWCKAGVLTPLHIGGKTFYRDSCLKIQEGNG